MDKDRRVGLMPIPDIDKAVEAFMQKNSRMAIEILRNGSPVQRTRFFQTAIESLADGIMSRKVSPRSLSSRMKELITLDGTKDSYDNESHARVRNALTKLDDDKAIKFSEMLSHQIAIKLRCFDLEYCGADRMAAYVRHFAHLFTDRLTKARKRQTTGRGRYVWEEIDTEYFTKLSESMELVLGQVNEREDDSDTNSFKEQVAKSLVSKDDQVVPHYVLTAIHSMAKDGCDNCEEFLGVLIGEDYGN